MSVGEKIIKIRKDNNLSQDDLAESLNVTRQTISNWENEKNYPDIETLVNISNKYNISLDKLLKEDKYLINKIDNKIKYNKKLKIYLLIFLIIIILLSIGLFYYKKHPVVELYEVKESFSIYELNTNKIINLIDYNKDNNIDLYLINDNTCNSDCDKPLIYNINIIGYKDKLGNRVDDIGNIEYILFEVSDEAYKLLKKAEINNYNFKIEKSDNKDNSSINYSLDYLLK